MWRSSGLIDGSRRAKIPTSQGSWITVSSRYVPCTSNPHALLTYTVWNGIADLHRTTHLESGNVQDPANPGHQFRLANGRTRGGQADEDSGLLVCQADKIPCGDQEAILDGRFPSAISFSYRWHPRPQSLRLHYLVASASSRFTDLLVMTSDSGSRGNRHRRRALRKCSKKPRSGSVVRSTDAREGWSCRPGQWQD